MKMLGQFSVTSNMHEGPAWSRSLRYLFRTKNDNDAFLIVRQRSGFFAMQDAFTTG